MCAMKMKVRKNDDRVMWKEELIRLYQKSGRTDFNELQDTVSTLNEGTNSLVTSRRMVCRAWAQNERYKICNGWFSGLVVPISSIVGVSILYIHSKNVLGQQNLSDSFRGSLFTVPARF